MSNSGYSKNNNNNTNTNSGSRRKLALAVLLLILFAGAWVCLSDSTFASGIRNDVLGRLGLVQETADGNDASAGAGDTSSGYENGSGTGAGAETDSDNNGYGSGEQGDEGGSGYAGSSAELPWTNAENALQLPQYNGTNYIEINGGEPDFPREVYERAGLVYENGKWKTSGTVKGVDPRKLVPYEQYGRLDNLGRCTVCYGCLGDETMPAAGEERGNISSIHPSGWAKGQGWERSHLIAWALGAENANSSNLITGSHYLNYDGMRPLEEETEHYIWNTGNHVLYYSRPVFAGDELVPRGVHMMAQSIEDGGKGVSFNVYCFNVVPGAEIDYMTGIVTTEAQASQDARLYIVNTRSRVFHYPSCDGAKQISKHNRKEVTATRVELTSQGYTPCGSCEP